MNGIKQTLTIIKKNFKRLLRSRISALIIIAGPLLLMLLVGIAFDNSQLYGINVGVHSESQDNITEALVEDIKSHDFAVNKAPTKDECVKGVKEGKNHLCIVIKPTESIQKKFEFHVDYSKLNLVYTLLNILSRGISESSTEISEQLVQELLEKVESTSGTIRGNTDKLSQLRQDLEGVEQTIEDARSNLVGLSPGDVSPAGNLSQAQEDITKTKSDIDTFQNDFEESVSNYQQRLASTEEDLETLEEELGRGKQNMTALKKNLSATYDNLGCTSTEKVLTVLDADVITEKLSQSSEPQCALLYSMTRFLDQRIQLVDAALAEIRQTQEEVDQAQQDLAQSEKQVSSTSEDAERRIGSVERQLFNYKSNLEDLESKQASMQQKRRQLESQLGSVQNLASQGRSQLNDLEGELKSITGDLENVSVSTPESIVSPVVSSINPLQADMNVLDFIFPSLLVLVITFTGILLASTIIMKEKSSSAYFRNFITPSPNVLFILGTYITSLVVVLFQAIVLFIVGAFFFNAQPFVNFPSILVALLFISSVFIFMGMIIGYLFNSEETGTLAAITLSSILFLFSSMIIPIEQMGSFVRWLAKASPFVLSETVMKQMTLFTTPFTGVGNEVLYIGAYVVGLFGLVMLARKESQHFMEK